MLSIKQSKQDMKKKIKANLFFSAAIITICVFVGGCEKSAFDPEKVKATYENKFPVKDIAPLMDWKTTNPISATASVFEDTNVNYNIRICDINPLEEATAAKLLASGIANDKLLFSTKIDCPSYLTEVYVCRTDAAGRNVARDRTTNKDWYEHPNENNVYR